MQMSGRTMDVRRSRMTAAPSPVKGPRPLRRWLDDLVEVEPLSAVAPVRQSLMLLSRTRLAPAGRLALLEEYPAALGAMVAHAGRRRIGMTVPVSSHGRALLGEIGVLHGLLARNYLLAVDDDGDGEPVDVALVLERAMSNLIEVLCAAYEAYEPVPEDTWRTLHGLYARARSLGVEARRVPDPHNAVHPFIDISTVYRHALLLGLADPYQLPFRAVARLRGRLPQWAQACELTVQNAARRRRCRFLIDLQADRPGFPVLGREGALDERRHLVLNTAPLVVSLHHTLQTLRDSIWKSAQSPAVSDLELLDLLRTLLVRWGMHPIRARTRVRLSRTYQFAAGLRGILRELDHAGPAPAIETVVLEGDGPAAGDAAAQPGHLPPGTWESIDVSDTGWRLGASGASAVELRVGELVALRGAGESDWSVGAVRWARGRGEGRFEIGVQRLGRAPRPAALWPAGLDDEHLQDTRSRPALYLPPSPDSGVGHLLCDPGGFRPGHVYHVQAGTERHLVNATELVYSTRSFECFSFRLAYRSV